MNCLLKGTVIERILNFDFRVFLFFFRSVEPLQYQTNENNKNFLYNTFIHLIKQIQRMSINYNVMYSEIRVQLYASKEISQNTTDNKFISEALEKLTQINSSTWRKSKNKKNDSKGE